ncbi:MAG TPA: carboxypeptidase-like regulatory domain-containing protein [Myxococcales bacterium]|nr:carboxypeptidase-like regulatory domain-containing protein [Myxococcales bacterium]
MAAADSPRRFPVLPLGDRVALLALSVAVFLAIEARSGHLFSWDGGIGWSYAAVPALVLAALVLRRRFAPLPWFLHSLEIAVGKFAVTAGMLMVVLIVSKPPPRPPVQAPPPAVRAAEAVLPDPPVAAGQLRGRVLRGGRPVRALVFVSGGLPAYRWPVPASPLRLTNDGTGILPRLAAAQVGQQILAASRDGRLHTLLLQQEGTAWRFNVPLLASGAEAAVAPASASGVLEATCAVHGAAERPATLVLVPSPFFQWTQADGSYAFVGVPAGSLTVTALAEDGTSAGGRVTVVVGSSASADLTLAP